MAIRFATSPVPAAAKHPGQGAVSAALAHRSGRDGFPFEGALGKESGVYRGRLVGMGQATGHQGSMYNITLKLTAQGIDRWFDEYWICFEMAFWGRQLSLALSSASARISWLLESVKGFLQGWTP